MQIIGQGTQLSVVGTEHTLAADVTSKVYVIVIDAAAMATGDELELRVYSTVRSGGTERLAYLANFQGAQDGSATDKEPIKISVPVPADISFRATLKQTAGSPRSYPWKVLSL